jgi:hypothetical protein
LNAALVHSSSSATETNVMAREAVGRALLNPATADAAWRFAEEWFIYQRRSARLDALLKQLREREPLSPDLETE